MGLSRNATAATIREKYLALAKKLHPDAGGNARAFQDLQEAYAVLSDPVNRRAYAFQCANEKLRQMPPVFPENAAALDLMGLFQKAAAGRVPQGFIEQLSPVLERKLDEHGVNARAATAEQVLQAVGWLKPKRKKRA